MLGIGPRPLAAAYVTCLLATPLAAQIDYRNLDEGLPGRVADAYPVERHAFELSLPYAMAVGGGGTLHALEPGLAFGVAGATMLDLRLRWTGAASGGRPRASEVRVGLLRNLIDERPALPALSVGAEVATPLEGGDAGDVHGSLTVLATRSVGRARLHANAGVTVGRFRMPGGRWWIGAAGDLTLYRTSTLLVGEARVEDGAQGVDWVIGSGVRRQLTPTLVGYLGVEQRFASGGDTSVRIGVSHVFGIAGLLSGRRP